MIWGEGSAYAVPVAVLERHRLPPERRAQVEPALRGRVPDDELPPAEVPLWELTRDALLPYRVSEEEWTALAAQLAGTAAEGTQGFIYDGGYNCALVGQVGPGTYPTNPYTGYPYCTFFDLTRDSTGTLIGVFPMYRAPSSPGPYPGLH